MGYDFQLGGETYAVHPVYLPDRIDLRIEGRRLRVALEEGLSPGEHTLEIEGHPETIFIASRGDTTFLHHRGRTHRIDAINALERARREAAPSGGDDVLTAPMPGTVVEVAVEEGQTVEAGDLLLTIESMKLQTAITAPRPARVADVCVSAGATFDQGHALIRLEAEDTAIAEDESK